MRTVKFYGKTLFKCLKKVALLSILAIIIVCACCLILSVVSVWFWPEFHGSYSLGNNVYMMDWDGPGRIIVRGSSFEGKTCFGGAPLIPSYENQYDGKGNIVEYVVDAMSDENWIIAKTENKVTSERKYYIMDKRNISDEEPTEEMIKNRIESFSDSIAFSQKCEINKITIKWGKGHGKNH